MTPLETLNRRLSNAPIEAQRKFVLETIAHLNPCYETDGAGVYAITQVDDAVLALTFPMIQLFEPGGYGGVGLREGETAVALTPCSAPDILQRAAQHMHDRAAQRDQDGGERSMRRTVDAFNALTGHAVSERDGWLFMAVLKMARATTTPTGTPDDYEDLAAYAALAGESAQEKKA